MSWLLFLLWDKIPDIKFKERVLFQLTVWRGFRPQAIGSKEGSTADGHGIGETVHVRVGIKRNQQHQQQASLYSPSKVQAY